MSSLTDLLNPSFFLFLGILFLTTGLFTMYYESKFREQNHKFNTMLSLISSLAEEVNSVKFGLNQVAMRGGAGSFSSFQANLPELQKNLEQLKTVKTLIEVSDDEDDEDDLESGDDNDTESEDSGDESADDLIIENDDGIHLEESTIKILKMGKEDEDEEDEGEYEDEDDEGEASLEAEDLDSVSSNDEVQEEALEEQQEIAEPKEFVLYAEPESIDFANIKTINILDEIKTINILDESKPASTANNNENIEPIEYKKLSVQKLRTLVVERNLAQDSSKLKKPELLKLLGEE